MSGIFPTTAFNAVEFINEDPTLISQSQSGRTFARKLRGQRWKFTVRFPKISESDFRPIAAFIDAQRGGYESFTIVLPVISTSTGVGGGAPLVNGIGQTGSALIIDGCPLNTSGWRKAGDVFKIAGHTKIYRLTADADTDIAGGVTLSFIPPLIEIPGDNEALTFQSVPFTVRLNGSIQTYSLSIPNIIKTEIDLIEVF